MLAPPLVAEIRRLVATQHLSQRQIAQVVGVSRGTVATIAAGKRPDYEALRSARQSDSAAASGPPERCPDCGGMVYAPCRVCRTREIMAQAARPALRSDGGLLGLQLRDEHRQRYRGGACRPRCAGRQGRPVIVVAGHVSNLP